MDRCLSEEERRVMRKMLLDELVDEQLEDGSDRSMEEDDGQADVGESR